MHEYRENQIRFNEQKANRYRGGGGGGGFSGPRNNFSSGGNFGRNENRNASGGGGGFGRGRRFDNQSSGGDYNNNRQFNNNDRSRSGPPRGDFGSRYNDGNNQGFRPSNDFKQQNQNYGFENPVNNSHQSFAHNTSPQKQQRTNNYQRNDNKQDNDADNDWW